MLSLVRKLDGGSRSFWMVLLLFSMVFGTGLSTSARTRDKSGRQDIGIEERRWAEQRLWDLGYWAGHIDGTFDAGSDLPPWSGPSRAHTERYSLVYFAKSFRRAAR